MQRVTALLGAIACLFMLSLSGCSSDPVKDDIVRYSNSAIPAINKFDEDIGKKLDEINREGDKEVFLNKIRNEVLPLLKDIKGKVEVAKPKTRELQDAHQMYADMLNSMEAGMKSLADAIENNNQFVYRDAIDKINSCQEAENRFKNQVRDLARKHDVDLD
jgi:hypothetical protein